MDSLREVGETPPRSRAAPRGHFPRLRSLGFQIVTLPLTILLLWLTLTFAFLIADARERITAEVASSTGLARALVESAVQGMHAGGDPVATLDQLSRALPHARHVRIMVASTWQEAAAANVFPDADPDTSAPAWFVRLIAPNRSLQAVVLAVGGRPVGHVVIAPNPADEIDEIWRDFVYLSAICVLAVVANAAAAGWVFARALRPIRALASGLERLESGDFTARLPPLHVSELEPIGARFDRLAASLARSAVENRELYQRVVSLREAERKSIAHDLHDEIGPCLFGIRAEAACISEIAGGSEGNARNVSVRIAAINALVNSMQQINRRVLDALRPVALAELGIAAALRDLVDTWQERNPSVHVSLDVDDSQVEDIEERLSLAVYRIVQESLTNVARHASAELAAVTISREPMPTSHYMETGCQLAHEILHVQVVDNGSGLRPGTRAGVGLRGVEERVREFGGRVTIESPQSGGVTVDAWLPLRGTAP